MSVLAVIEFTLPVFVSMVVILHYVFILCDKIDLGVDLILHSVDLGLIYLKYSICTVW